MTADATLQPGYYWVRHKGNPHEYIAERTDLGWYVAGVSFRFDPKDIVVLSPRLTRDADQQATHQSEIHATMVINARFYCESVTQIGAPIYGDGNGAMTAEKIVLRAVYSSDKASPNYSYSEATPQASVELLITNKDAWGAFKPGHCYDAAFTPTAAE